MSVQGSLKLPKGPDIPPATLERMIEACVETKNKASAECQYLVQLEKDYQKRDLTSGR